VSPADGLSAIRRCNQVYYELVTDQYNLSCGVAFTSTKYPELATANQVREVVIPPGGSMAAAQAEVEDHFSGLGLRCRRWVPAATQPPDPLEAYLTAQGYVACPHVAMRLQEIPLFRDVPGVRIVPARAMRRALRQLVLENPYHPPALRNIAAQLELDRLDDPRMDMQIALVEGKPAGYAALLQVGELGGIYNVYVAEPFRRRGVATAMMKSLLALARRLALRTVALEVDAGNGTAQRFYERCGFVAAGSFVDFRPNVQP